MATATTSTRRRTSIITRAATGLIVAGAVGLAGAGTAHADHVHSKQVGNSACVLLAQNGGEGNVQLPFSELPENRRHPLHVLVHLGRAGENFAIGVYGTPSDPCFESGNYVNG
jgi:hypothetical protein